MYASLAVAGASALYDLYKSATDSGKTSGTSSGAAAFPTASADSASAGGASSVGSVGAVGSATAGGSRFSDALNKLFTDLQASTTGSASSADPTSTVADDLQSISKGLKSAGAHGRHHHGPAAIGDGDPATADASATGASTGKASNPFVGLASSLVAYARTQALGASTATSLTA